MNEKYLEQLLQSKDETDIDREIQKKIRKGIRKQIYSRVIILFVIAALVITGGAFGLSALFNLSCYNPKKVTPAIQEDGQYYDFHVLMETFLGLYYPDLTYVPVIEKCTSKGFGSYEVAASIQSGFEPLEIDGYSNVTFHIDRSKFDIEAAGSHAFTILANEFYDVDESMPDDYFFDRASVTPGLIAQIEELPDSSILNVSLSFGEDRSLEDTLAFMEKYENSSFHWIALHMNGSTPDGISLGNVCGYSLTEETQENYPDLFPENDLTAEKLKQCYLSRLKLLLDHKDFLGLLYSEYGSSMTFYHIQERYEDARTNGISAIGVRAYVKKQDLLEMIAQDEIPYVIVNDVRLSFWEK